MAGFGVGCSEDADMKRHQKMHDLKEHAVQGQVCTQAYNFSLR